MTDMKSSKIQNDKRVSVSTDQEVSFFSCINTPSHREVYMTCVGAVRRSGVEVSLSGGTAESSLLMNSSYKSSERCRLASTHLMFVKRL